jgi:hypothetical protein
MNTSSETKSSFSLTAYNKRANQNNFYQIVALSFLTVAMMIVSAIVFRNLITAAGLLICSIALFLFYLQKPTPITINYDDKKLSINGISFEWDSVKAWDVIEYGDLTEIDITTTKFVNTYITFYLKKSNFHDYNRFLDCMYQNAEFQKGLSYSNSFQNFLRIVGLK